MSPITFRFSVSLNQLLFVFAGTPEGVSRVVVGDEVTAGLEQDGKELATLTHTMITREGGYAFNPDL